MELLKLAAVFAVIVVLLWLKKPLYLSIIAATVAAGLLFGIKPLDFFGTILRSAVSWQTLSVLLLFYLVTFLQRMMEKRGNLILAQQSLDRLFNSRRITASLAPALLGLLPSGSVVAICGEIVERSVSGDLSAEEKAVITSYYRHIPESTLPTFSSIIISINLTHGVVGIAQFMAAMVPVIIVLAMLGYLFYLRRIPKETGAPPSQNKWRDFLGVCKGVWPVVLIIVLIFAFQAPVYAAATASILLFACTGRFGWNELRPFLRTAFEKNLLLSTLFIMIFKDVLNAGGAIDALPAILSSLPLPQVVILSLIFFIGTIISGSQAIAVLGVPMAFIAVPNAGVPLFVLLMGLAFAANQLTPTHVCLSVVSEYFGISFGALVKKSIPLIAVFCAALSAYYMLLSLF